MPPRPQLNIPSPGRRRAGRPRRRLVRHRRGRAAGPRRLSHDAADAYRRAGRAARDRAPEPRLSARVVFPRELRVEPMSTGLAGRLRVPRRAVARPREGDRQPAGRPGCRRIRRSSRWPRASSRRTGSRRRRCSTRPSASTAWPASAVPPTRARWSPGRGPRRCVAPTVAARGATIANVFMRAGVVREQTNDPSGVELVGRRQERGLARRGATGGQGLNAAGAAAGHIFAEVWRYAERQGAQARVVDRARRYRRPRRHRARTAVAQPARRRAARPGVPASEIPERIGQAVEALESVPLLAAALRHAHLDAPVTTGLDGLISGELPLEDWVALLRQHRPAARRPRQRRSATSPRASAPGHRVAAATD